LQRRKEFAVSVILHYQFFLLHSQLPFSVVQDDEKAGYFLFVLLRNTPVHQTFYTILQGDENLH